MKYSEFAEVYEEISKTSGRIEKEGILAKFFRELKKRGESEWVYLLKGRVLPEYDSGEFGISTQLTIKAIAKSYGEKESDVVKKYNKIGDLGEVAEEFAGKKRQSTLFSSNLTVDKVFSNLKKLIEITGKGTVGKRIDLISELLASASRKEAKYIVRTLLNDLRIGVADGVLRDALAEAFYDNEKKEMAEKIENVYNTVNDFAEVFDAASKGKKELEKISGVITGRPMKVMLPVKVTNVKDAFEIVGRPAALEHKYDGFRMIISKDVKGIKLFTRRLDDVTKQFPDVVKAVSENVRGKSFVLDSETVGYESSSKKYLPFQAISQRIKRKYDIEKIIDKLPVEVNVFDVVFYEGESQVDKPFNERRKLLEKIIKTKKLVIRTSEQIITDSDKKAEEFYKNALKIGEEGIMFKRIDASYKQGRHVGFMVKLKPEVKDLDLVIVGAEHGTGKRGGWLTSYIVACKHGDEFLEVGKVSSGLKEIESEDGTTYDEMTKMLKPLITGHEGNMVHVKPRIVVAVKYQEIQKSPSYSSGYALRFPRITSYRPDKPLSEITTLNEIENEVIRTKRK